MNLFKTSHKHEETQQLLHASPEVPAATTKLVKAEETKQLQRLLNSEKRFRLVANLAYYVTMRECGSKGTQSTRLTSTYTRLAEIVKTMCMEAYDLVVVFILLEKYYRSLPAMRRNKPIPGTWHAETVGQTETRLFAAIYTEQCMLYDQPLRKSHWGDLIRDGSKDGGYSWLVNQAFALCTAIDYDFSGLTPKHLVSAHSSLIGSIEEEALLAYRHIEAMAKKKRKVSSKPRNCLGRTKLINIF